MVFLKVLAWGHYCSAFSWIVLAVVKLAIFFCLRMISNSWHTGVLSQRFNLKGNKMELASNKCSQLVIKGRISSFRPAGGPLRRPNSVTDHCLAVNTPLTRSENFKNHLTKSNKVLLIFRGVCRTKWTRKSRCASTNCWRLEFIHVSQLDLQELKKFQKRVLK